MLEDEDTDIEAFADTLEGLDFEIEAKADGYAKIIRQVEGNINSIDEELKRLQKMKKTYSNKIDALKTNLENGMRKTGKVKFKTELFSFGIQKNPASLVIDKEDQIPPEYLIIEPTVNKAAIKDAIKNGQSFEFAHLEQTESLRIR